jgi:hypothetical protein
MAIKVVHLVSGEEWIADEETVDGQTVLKNPTKAMPVRTETGDMGLAFVPVCAYFEDFTGLEEITINSSHVIFTAEVPEEIKNAYCERFSKIILPGSGHIQLS